MALTRKDFVALSNALLETRPEQLLFALVGENRALQHQWENDVLTVTNALASTNQHFDRAAFLHACGLRGDHVIFSTLKRS